MGVQGGQQHEKETEESGQLRSLHADVLRAGNKASSTSNQKHVVSSPI